MRIAKEAFRIFFLHQFQDTFSAGQRIGSSLQHLGLLRYSSKEVRYRYHKYHIFRIIVRYLDRIENK